MEIVIIAAVAVAGIGWWIWKEGQHEKNGHPLDSVTKPTVHVVDVADAAPAEAVAIVEKAQAKAKKAPAKKVAAPKAKKPAAPKKAPAKKTTAKKPKSK